VSICFSKSTTRCRNLRVCRQTVLAAIDAPKISTAMTPIST